MSGTNARTDHQHIRHTVSIASLHPQNLHWKKYKTTIYIQIYSSKNKTEITYQQNFK